MPHTRSREAKKRRRERWRQKRLLKKTTFDQKTGEVVNIQEHYIHFKIVPQNLGFQLTDVARSDIVGTMFLHQGEVLIDRQGTGTIQARPEVFV